VVDFQIAERYGMDDLLKIMELLRAPGGCPWDRAQTHQSIRANMLEEAYEAADAIDHMDMDNLKEELGDVLLQVVFHARMAQEAGRFTFDDVVDGVCRKLVYRHPNVFGTADARDGSEALAAWDAQKRAEKGQRTAGDALDSVARALPALTRAAKLQGKAAKAGFDWKDVSHALDKLLEQPGLHGIQVGIATYLMSRVQDHRYKRVDTIFTDTGLWEHVASLGLNREDYERAIDLAPSVKPFRHTYLHEEKYRELAKKILREDERLGKVFG